MRNLAAQDADLLDQARGDELMAVRGHHEHDLDLRVETAFMPVIWNSY
jgi:hypothetical protein